VARALNEIATRVAVLRSNLSNGERPYRRPGRGSSHRSRGWGAIHHANDLSPQNTGKTPLTRARHGHVATLFACD